MLALLFLLLARFALRAFYGCLWRRGFARQKALLLGSPERLADFERRLAIQRYRGYAIAGVLVRTERISHRLYPSSLPVLGSIADWEKIAGAEGAELVVIHLPESSGGDHTRVLEIVRRCGDKGIEIEVYSHLFGPPDLRFERDEFSGCFRLDSPPRWPAPFSVRDQIRPRYHDWPCGSVATLALTPLVALLIKAEDGGAIFNRREYVGMDGRIHHFLKFRTMVEDAEQVLETTLRSRRNSTAPLS